jgi:phosphoribosylformimino-5-aminoimidazole carboxamide ribotide isomerase
MDQSTIFNHQPDEQAKLWVDQGATRIHLVDLDGSIKGGPSNKDAIEKIIKASKAPVQLGGGIRDENIIKSYLDMGVDTVIMGTAAVRAPDRVRGYMDMFPGKIAVAVDARDGMVAVSGWTQGSSMSADQLAKEFEDSEPAAFIYTDIEKDGMMKGPNINATREFAAGRGVDVILSGGVTRLEDVKQAASLRDVGVTGIIIGRALYEETIDLKEAIKIVEAL